MRAGATGGESAVGRVELTMLSLASRQKWMAIGCGIAGTILAHSFGVNKTVGCIASPIGQPLRRKEAPRSDQIASEATTMTRECSGNLTGPALARVLWCRRHRLAAASCTFSKRHTCDKSAGTLLPFSAI